MGPKKAKGKKGKGEGKKKKTDAQREVSGADLASMEEEQERKTLVVSADAMFHQTTKEEHDFNEYQQQREKLNYFWIVEKKKLEDKKAELRNKERELQDLEERHQVEIKVKFISCSSSMLLHAASGLQAARKTFTV